jgi:hypothetical protein
MTNQSHLETLHAEAANHALLQFVRARRARRFHHAVRSLYRLALEVVLGQVAQPALSR